MNGWIDFETMTNDYSSYSIIPSRQGHKIIDISGQVLEVIAWQIETNNKDGEVTVRPITIFGIYYDSMIKEYQQPSMRQKKTRAEYAQ